MFQLRRIALFVLGILPVLVMGQFSIKGKLTDMKTNEPLAGGKLFIENTYKVTASDSKGNFELKNIKKGKWKLMASYMGYESEEKEIIISDSDYEINIMMIPDAVLGEEVIISATRAEDKTPMTFENIPKKDIMQLNMGQDIPMLIENTASVTTSTDAGTGVGYTYLRIRGVDATRINVTVNGIPFNDPESHEVYWVDMPDFASSIENLQIQRGVGASTNGSAAFGASINLQTTTIKPNAYGEYAGSFGSYNTLKNTVSFGTGLIDNKFEFDGRFSKISSDGYIDRASSDLKSFFISGGYYGKSSFVKFNVYSGKEKTYQAWSGVPKLYLDSARTYNPYTYKNQVDDFQQDHYELFYSNEFSRKLNLNVALFDIRGKGYYENFEQKKDPYIFADPDTLFADYGLKDVIFGIDTIRSSNFVNRKWLDNNFCGVNLSLNYDNLKKLKINFGASWNQYDGKHFGKIIWAEYASNGSNDRNWYDNKGTKIESSAFAKANYQATEKLSFYGDLQYRNINYKIAGIHDNLLDISQTHNFNFINPKAGLFYDFDDKNNLYLSFAVANREPNRSNYEDATAGQQPKAERLYDYEMGYTFKNTNFRANVNLYFMDYKDQLVLTGKINNVGAPVMTNVPLSQRKGVEIVLAANLTDRITMNGNITLSKNEISNFTEFIDDWDNGGQKQNFIGTTDISFSPSVIGSYSFTFKILKNLHLTYIMKFVGKQYADNTSNNDRSIDPYAVDNVLLKYTFKTKYIKEIGLSFLVNNIFSEKYETNAWYYSYYFNGVRNEMNGYFPQAPVNVMGGVTFKF